MAQGLGRVIFVSMPKHPSLVPVLKRIPSSPGVYQFFDEDGKILYVGKAKNLKNRVSSYFNKQRYESGKTKVLAGKVRSIRWMVVEHETDALLLENSLIKEHQPYYNIRLKDDKSFPSIVIKKERFPRIFPTRRIVRDGSEYFGPYTSVKTMHAVLDLIRKMYPIRTCNFALTEENIAKGKFKVCLEYHLGNCLGPCEGYMSEQDYDENVASIRSILKGDLKSLIRTFKGKMVEAAENLEFERAQELKNRLDLIEKFQEKTVVVHPSIHNVEVFTIVSDSRSGYVNYLKIRDGSIVHGRSTELRKGMGESDRALLEFAIVEFREQYASDCPEIYVPFEVDLDLDGVKIHIPQRGDKARLLELSERNARYYMRDKHKQLEQVDPEANQKRILSTLQKDLHMKELPVHIECFDNSNIQGTNPASACVVFRGAKPAKQDYRKYNIKTVQGPDDFASMEEVVFRRYRRLSEDGDSLPQLVIIDGGKGQLSSAMRALDRLELRGQMTVIGIAKRLEEIYFPGDQLPVYIDKRSESLKLIQQLRNEAHRFSLAHHRTRRSNAAIQTELQDIPGVGKTSAEKLLRHYKSVKAIRAATLADMINVVGKSIAGKVYRYFQDNTSSLDA